MSRSVTGPLKTRCKLEISGEDMEPFGCDTNICGGMESVPFSLQTCVRHTSQEPA